MSQVQREVKSKLELVVLSLRLLIQHVTWFFFRGVALHEVFSSVKLQKKVIYKSRPLLFLLSHVESGLKVLREPSREMPIVAVLIY